MVNAILTSLILNILIFQSLVFKITYFTTTFEIKISVSYLICVNSIDCTYPPQVVL